MLFASQFNTSSEPSDVQTFIEKNVETFFDLPSDCGSFKTVKQISDTLAVASMKHATAVEMFDTERKLLNLLRDMGLPTIKYYGDVFTIKHVKAVIIDWLSDATLIDSKDLDSSSSKLFALTLGVNIPMGEGWVLYKNRIEKDIRLKLQTSNDSFELFKMRVEKLLQGFKAILSCLNDNQILICDLQMMVTQEGLVWIIDPQDVVKFQIIDVNQYAYTSLHDLSKQTNLDFIKKIHDGKNLITDCINWCEKMTMMRTPQDVIDFICKGPESVPSPRGGNLLSHVKQKLSPRGGPAIEMELSPRGHARTRRISIQQRNVPDAQSSILPILEPQLCNNILKEIQTMLDTDLIVIPPVKSPKTTPNSSPTKPRAKENTENLPRDEALDVSPTKLLAFQFNSVSFGSAKRSLFTSDDDEALAAEQAITKSSSMKADLNV